MKNIKKYMCLLGIFAFLSSVNFANCNCKDDIKKVEDKIAITNTNIDKNRGGIASVTAIANIPQVTGEKLFTIGAGAAYHNYHGALALGISGQTKNKTIIYKSSIGVDFKGSFSVGAGVAYALGKTNTTKVTVVPETKIVEKVEKLDPKLDELENELANLKMIVNNLMKENNNEEEVQIESKEFVISHFKNDKYTLSKKQMELIDNELIAVDTNREIVVVGYTDTNASERYNLRLGFNRALKVKDYLNSKGYMNVSVKSTGYNTIISVKDNSLNRRVEVLVK